MSRSWKVLVVRSTRPFAWGEGEYQVYSQLLHGPAELSGHADRLVFRAVAFYRDQDILEAGYEERGIHRQKGRDSRLIPKQTPPDEPGPPRRGRGHIVPTPLYYAAGTLVMRSVPAKRSAKLLGKKKGPRRGGGGSSPRVHVA